MRGHDLAAAGTKGCHVPLRGEEPWVRASPAGDMAERDNVRHRDASLR